MVLVLQHRPRWTLLVYIEKMKPSKAASKANPSKTANVVPFEPSKEIRSRIRQVSKLDDITEQQLVTAAVIGYLDGTDAQKRYFDSVHDGPLCRREYIEIMKPEKFVDVQLQVPPSAAALFPGPRLVHLPCAGAFDEKSEDARVTAWKEPHLIGAGGVAMATSQHLAAMMKEGCTATAGFRFPLEEWKHIERIALRLKVTVGDYLLGCVGYAVWLNRQEPTPVPLGTKVTIE